MMILQPRSKNPRELLLRAAVFVVMSLFSVMRHADAASSPQTPAQSGEVQVFASADESSPVIESVADGKSLLPIAEMTGAGGLKWFMVKTRNGNVGWIKAGDKMGAAKIDDHFRSLPKDSSLVGPTSGVAESVSTPPATGAITIPVKIYGTTVIVPVSFKNGYSTATAYLALDTGAGQTMVSKRVARDLRLRSIDSQRSIGIGGSVVADVGVVDMVMVGQAAIRNMRVSIHDLVVNFGYEGLLGFDFLGRFQMSVDSDKQVLVLTPRK
jgi:predicted aspartyl protease